MFVAFIGILIYSAVEVMFGSFGQIDHSPTYIIPFRINSVIILIFMLASALATGYFPLWNVKKYYRFLTKKQIAKYKSKYSFNYYKIFVGFFALLVWSSSSLQFDSTFWIGLTITIIVAVWLLILPNKRKIIKPKESQEPKEEYSVLKILQKEKESVTPRKNLTFYEHFKNN